MQDYNIKMDHGTARKAARKLGANLQKDIDDGLFDHPDAWQVGWLIHQPKTLEDIAENLFERLRSVGGEINLSVKDTDYKSIARAEEIRSELRGY